MPRIPAARRLRPTCRRTCATWPRRRRVASFDHRHRFVGSLTYALPGFGGSGLASKLGSGWQVNGIVLLESGAPFTVNLGTDRANIGAGPAQRPDMTCDPNQGGARTAAAMVQHELLRAAAAVHVWQRRRATPCWRPATPTSTPRSSKTSSLGERRPAAIALGDLQSAEPRQLRRAEPRRVHAELRPDLQRQAAPSDAVRRRSCCSKKGAWVLGARSWVLKSATCLAAQRRGCSGAWRFGLGSSRTVPVSTSWTRGAFPAAVCPPSSVRSVGRFSGVGVGVGVVSVGAVREPPFELGDPVL